MYILSFTFIWNKKFSYSSETIVASIENATNHVVDRKKMNVIPNKIDENIIIFTVNHVSTDIIPNTVKIKLASILNNCNIKPLDFSVTIDEYSWWKKHTKHITLFFGGVSLFGAAVGFAQLFI